MQPTAQAVGRNWETVKPQRGERLVVTQSLQSLTRRIRSNRVFRQPPQPCRSGPTKMRASAWGTKYASGHRSLRL